MLTSILLVRDHSMSAAQRPGASVTFVGPINYPATKNLRNLCCQLAGNGVPEIYLQFSSTGGSLVEGFALFNFLRSLPAKLTTHNIGSIESIANVVFLAGEERYASAETHFLLHGFDWTFSEKQSLVHERIKEISMSLAADEKRFVAILKARSGMADADIQNLDFFRKSTVVEASDAKRYGLIHDVRDAKIPAGWQAWNVDY